MKEVTCNNCGWVHFGISRSIAEAEVAEFNKFYDNATPEIQRQYGGRANISRYEKCFKCGGDYRNFRDSQDGDCPEGVTIQGILLP